MNVQAQLRRFLGVPVTCKDFLWKTAEKIPKSDSYKYTEILKNRTQIPPCLDILSFYKICYFLANSYFITGCHERSFIKEGCEGRQGKADSDLQNAPRAKATAVKQQHKLAYVWQPQRSSSKNRILKKWLGHWAEGEDGQKPTLRLLPLHCASCSPRDTFKTNSSAFKENICDPRWHFCSPSTPPHCCRF